MSKNDEAQASLTLYAYHLRTDISKGAEQLSDEADQIWEGLVKLGHALQIPALQRLKQELICYTDGKYEPTVENQLAFQRGSLLRAENKYLKLNFTASIGGKNVELNGKLNAFRLDDTYAIDLTLSSDSIDELKQLNPKELLPPQYIQASIGKTLFVYGKLAAPCEDESLEKLADDYVAQLMVDGIPLELNSKGKLLSNPIFEYEMEIEPSKRCHLLIWFINEYTPTEKQLKQVGSHILPLLCARHKILSAYNDYQLYNHQAKNLHSQLEQHLKKFEDIATKHQSYQLEVRLQELKKLLAIVATKVIDYSKWLWYIKDYETTIATNIKNYELSYKKLRELPDNNLSFLEEFIELTHNKYEAQLKIDRQYLEPEAKLLQQLIDTTRGMVAIDQVESDRLHEDNAKKREEHLEVVIAGVSAGLACSSVSAAVMPEPSETLLPGFKSSIGGFSFLIDVGFHLLWGLIVGRFMVCILKKIRS